MALQLTAQALELAAGQDGLAMLAAQVVLLLHQLTLLLLQELHLLLGVPVLFQLGTERQVSALWGSPHGDLGSPELTQPQRSPPTLAPTAQAGHCVGTPLTITPKPL